MKGLEDEQPKALFLHGSQEKIKWFNIELKHNLLLAIMANMTTSSLQNLAHVMKLKLLKIMTLQFNLRIVLTLALL